MVDDEDYEEINKYKWFASARGYAVRNFTRDDKTRGFIRMHGEIIGEIKGLEIDHINGEKTDNRKANLRHATHAQNVMNSRGSRGTTSAYKGVYWNKMTKSWRCTITTNGKKISLGCYQSEEDAKMVYNTWAKYCYGEFAWLNI